MLNLLIGVLERAFKKDWFKSSGFASKVISISELNVKYLNTSSISLCISSTLRIEGAATKI